MEGCRAGTEEQTDRARVQVWVRDRVWVGVRNSVRPPDPVVGDQDAYGQKHHAHTCT